MSPACRWIVGAPFGEGVVEGSCKRDAASAVRAVGQGRFLSGSAARIGWYIRNAAEMDQVVGLETIVI